MTQDEKRKAVAEAMLAYYSENEDDFNNDIEELDSWNGYLNDDRYYQMEELDDLLSGLSPLEILEKVGRDFNYCDDFVQFGIYGMESSNYKDYSNLLGIDFCNDIIDNASHLYLCSEIQEMIDSLDEEDEEDEDGQAC